MAEFDFFIISSHIFNFNRKRHDKRYVKLFKFHFSLIFNRFYKKYIEMKKIYIGSHRKRKTHKSALKM